MTAAGIYCVAVGASVGGIPALREFFAAAPAEAAYVVVLHQPAHGEAALEDLLTRCGPMSAKLARRGDKPLPGQILILAPGEELSLEKGEIRVQKRPREIPAPLPFDALLTSLADEFGPRGVAVILSGSGQDGAKGARRIRGTGGMIFTQDTSAEFESMPRAIRVSSGADWVAPPKELAIKLGEVIATGGDRHLLRIDEARLADLSFSELLTGLATDGQIDATIFDQSVLADRWQALREAGTVPDTLSEAAVRLLETNPLLQENRLLQVLREQIVPNLIDSPAPLRIWLPCCGAGHDAHVISGILRRAHSENHSNPRFSLFATDVDKSLFQEARVGRYLKDAFPAVSDDLHTGFLDPIQHELQVRPSVREHTVFAVHDLVRDDPFARMHLIILGPTAGLLRPQVRQEAVEQLSFSMRPGSLLLVPFPLTEVPAWLIRSKDYPGLFECRVSGRHAGQGKDRQGEDRTEELARPAPLPVEQRLSVLAAHALIEDLPGGSAIIDQDLRPLQIDKSIEPLLQVPCGTRDVTLPAMIREPVLRQAITRSIQQARLSGQTAREELLWTGNGCRIHVHPLEVGNHQARGYAIWLHHWTISEDPGDLESESGDATVRRLHADLTETRRQLAQAVDCLETKREQLQSTDEELLAVNEKLHKVNAELETKIDQLTHLGQDLESIMHGTQVGVLFLDRDLRIRRFTPDISSLVPVQAGDIGRHLSELHFMVDSGKLMSLISKVTEDGEQREVEVFVAQSGWRLLRVLPVRDHDARGVMLISIDIHRLKLAETSLQRRTEELETLLHAHPDEVYRIGADGVIKEQKGFVRDGSRVGSRLMEHLSEEGRARLDQALLRIESGAREYWAEFADTDPHDRPCDMELRVVPVPDGSGQIIVLLRNISPLKSAERQRLEIVKRAEQNQHLESLGVLAGGIAHDFNNILAGIQGNAELAQSELPPGSETGDRLLRIQLACEQAAGLCRQMLNYAGKGQNQDEVVDLSGLIDETVPLVDHQLRSHGGHLELDLDHKLPRLMADKARLRQVILNLVLNAIEALPEKGGWIRVRTNFSNMAEEAALSLHSNAAPPSGKYLVFSVQDNGHGMDEQTRSRVFQPFFSTKFSGRGLGLAAVHGIVRSHRGHIDVQSTPGEGSSFRVYLPCGPIQENLIPALPPRTRQARPAQGRILVADDEEQIRMVTKALLTSMGYEVTSVTNGRQAVETLESPDNDYVAAILDITMPDMGGMEAASVIRNRHPTLPILTMSGFLVEDLEIPRGEEAHTGFLQKPFSASCLRTALDAVLHPPP